MKKLLLIFVLFLSLVLAACGDSEDNADSNDASGASDEATEEQTDDGETEEEPAEEEELEEETNGNLTIGDTAEVDGVQFTLTSVSTTDERNEFADTDPTMVVRIEYEIVNNTDSEIPVGGDLDVYDGTGTQIESYPLDNTLGSLQPGKKIEGVDHFGIEEGPIEIYFAPLISFEDPAIFTADVE